MGARNYRDLVVWQKAMDFVVTVYGLSAAFPAAEQFGLTSQLRRSVVSVPSNIAEGEGRESPGDFRRFLSIAHGSIREAKTQLIIAKRLHYLEVEPVGRALDQAAEIGRMIRGLSKSLS